MSTWYRNASTVHYRTDNAVPALLTGKMPPGDLLPLESEYPDNLFRLIHDSGQYEMTVFEPYTRLCPPELRPQPARQSVGAQLGKLLSTLFLVGVDTTMPDDIQSLNDLIPRQWFGLPEDLSFADSSRTGLMQYGWDRARRQQFQHFEDCLVQSKKPGFRFLHVVTPHYPWVYAPSGRAYLDDADAGDYPPGTFGITGEDWISDALPVNQAWQRYLMQLMAVDRSLDALLDQLGAEGLLHDALVIVTADHGVAFQPGVTRREPTPETLTHIMPIPLFVKLPHQRQACVSDRNCESIDVFPTIVDVLNLDPQVSTDGQSLIDPDAKERPRKTIRSRLTDYIVEPDFPQRFEYTDQMVSHFGSGDASDKLMRWNCAPELTGRQVQEFPQGPDAGPVLEMTYRTRSENVATEDYVPCFFRGTVRDVELDLPLELAIAVDGRIEATTRTMLDEPFDREWSVVIPESVFSIGRRQKVEIFRIRRHQSAIALELCVIQQ